MTLRWLVCLLLAAAPLGAVESQPEPANRAASQLLGYSAESAALQGD